MSKDASEFEIKLHESRKKYINGLVEKLCEIRLLWSQALLNPIDYADSKDFNIKNETIIKMKYLVHNLAGSGGTFGFPKISEQAKLLENIIDEALKNNDLAYLKNKKMTIDSLLMNLQEISKQAISTLNYLYLPNIETDFIYILDLDKPQSMDLSQQLIYYGCKVKVINDIDSFRISLKTIHPLIILMTTDFAEKMSHDTPFVQALRNNFQIECPIIFLSSRSDLKTRLSAIHSSGSAYFTTPLDISLLMERINILTNASMLDPYRILIVEDDEQIAQHYSIILEKCNMRVSIETNPENILNKISQENPELVVMDLYMPDFNGLDLIKVIRQHQSFLTLPIILLTAANDLNLHFVAREIGVDDFLVKPISAVHLAESVLNRVQRSRYMHASMAKDSLTGLYVHKRIIEHLDMQLHNCIRYDRMLCYAILDIDHFKSINDTYGHLVGDRVLIAFANILKSNVRLGDFVGRYGGEEFVIIFPETDESAVMVILQRIRNIFSGLAHFAEDKVFHATFSAGVASYPKYSEVDILMSMADKALFYSKNHGRNKITIG